MKISNFSKLIGAGVLAASLAVVPFNLSASAQQSNTSSDNTTTTGTNRGVDNTRRDNDFDWGWFGLLGLAGLAGLAGRKRPDPVRHRTEDEVRTTNYGR